MLDKVSFSINSGDKLALTGANGAGKTTLLQLLVGLIPRQSGEILAMSEVQLTETDFVQLRQQVGLVFQDPDDQLFCPSVLEDVM
ncbi:MAG: ATP-binding cassette domain-containing protein, partial [Pseudomonadales bacterium]|nr:ATP-binding cassette domain-containing protein [Pseudomonadales bacterium]